VGRQILATSDNNADIGIGNQVQYC